MSDFVFRAICGNFEALNILHMDDKRLFLLDAYALIYRAYYALIRAPRVTSYGLNTSAIFGFCNTLDEILRKENPSHIAVCFDPPHGRTFRHDLYPEYKAQRDAQPEDITASIPYIKSILEAYRIPVIEVEGYEADDVIGTLSRRAEEQGFTTYMMTPDKDYGQLVTDHVFMYRPALKGQGFEIRGPREVCDRYGIESPVQVIDLLALEGDASDNIPGCPGVGEKTAAKLIREFHSIDNLLQSTDSLKGALQKKIVENADQIRFSKQLVTISTDAPVDATIDSLVRLEPDIDALSDIYRTLEFRTFLSRLNAATTNTPDRNVSPSARPEIPADGMMSLFDLPAEEDTTPALNEKIPHTSAEEISTPARLAEVCGMLMEQPEIALVMITDGDPEAMRARWTGLVLASSATGIFHLPLRGSKSEIDAEMLSMLQPLVSTRTSGPVVICSDIKYAMVVMRNAGVSLGAPYFDTSLAHYILQPEMKNNVAESARIYLGLDMTVPPRLKSGETEPESSVLDRAIEEASVLLKLRSVLEDQIQQQNQSALLNDIELPFAAVLARMEYTGVRIDPSVLNEMSEKLTTRLHDLEQQAYALAGEQFNPGSPAQVGEILFGRLKIDPKAKKTKTGAYSTTEEILEKLRGAHPLVGLILDIRGLRKLLATYVNALPLLVNPHTGKIHTTFNQTATATGRISSTNPNLQNIPIRTDEGREIRRAFIADSGCMLLSADYSQIELRLMAHLSQDPHMTEAFLSGEDIHRATAAKIHHIEPSQVSDNQRRAAKTANFGIIYGISAFGLSQRLNISRADAKALIEGYFNAYPGVKEYMDRAISDARRDGYVTTVKERKRYLPDINSRNAVVRGYAERNAINAPLQGSAADIIKIAMIAIDREFTRLGLRSRMIMQVHDELVFNVIPDELEQVRDIVIRQMESAYPEARVPLTVSSGVATDWLDAH